MCRRIARFAAAPNLAYLPEDLEFVLPAVIHCQTNHWGPGFSHRVNYLGNTYTWRGRNLNVTFDPERILG